MSDIEYLCCSCHPNPVLDSNSLVLYNQRCPQHGLTWHREMVRVDEGRLKLRYPLDPTGPVYD